MNRFLASIAGVLNEWLAIPIVVVWAIVGYTIFGNFLGSDSGSRVVGLILGAVVGLDLVVFFCGGLALIIDIRESLRQLVELNRATRLRDNQTPVATSPTVATPAEATLRE